MDGFSSQVTTQNFTNPAFQNDDDTAENILQQQAASDAKNNPVRKTKSVTILSNSPSEKSSQDIYSFQEKLNEATHVASTVKKRSLRRFAIRRSNANADDQGASDAKPDHLSPTLNQLGADKLGLKFFGSRDDITTESDTGKKTGEYWRIHPNSKFKLYWDVLLLVLMVMNLTAMPVWIAFFYEHPGFAFLIFNAICDLVFIIDIVLSFLTGVIDKESSHRDKMLTFKEASTHYLKTWFVVDLLASLPFDYLFLLPNEEYQGVRAVRLIRIVKLLQLLRLLRVSRFTRLLRSYLERHRTTSTVISIANQIFVMVFVCHWSGCIMFLIPVMQGYPSDSWIMKDQIKDYYWFDQYVRALFKALSHLLSIGYGQYPPQTNADNWATTFSMLICCASYAMFIGHTMALYQSINASRIKYREKLQEVTEYMKYRKLPTQMQKKILDYYDYRHNGNLFDEEAILNSVSDRLKQDMTRFICKDLINNVPFFETADPHFVDDVISRLVYEIFQPGDKIIKAGYQVRKMYFIQSGCVQIISATGELITTLSDGSYFGEIGLLTNGKSTATVQTDSYCNLFSLCKEQFNTVLEHYPAMRDALEAIAAERLSDLSVTNTLSSRRNSLREDLQGIKEALAEHATHMQINEAVSENHQRRRSPVFQAFYSFFFEQSRLLS